MVVTSNDTSRINVNSFKMRYRKVGLQRKHEVGSYEKHVMDMKNNRMMKIKSNNDVYKL